MLPLFAFMHLHCWISSRYARCTMCGHEAHDNGVKPEDGISGPIPKMEGPLECMPRAEMPPIRCKLIKLICVGSQASPRAFSASYVFTNITLVLYVWCIRLQELVGNTWCIEPPCAEIYLEPYVGPGSNICLAMLRPVEVGWFPITCEI